MFVFKIAKIYLQVSYMPKQRWKLTAKESHGSPVSLVRLEFDRTATRRGRQEETSALCLGCLPLAKKYEDSLLLH